MYEDAEDDREDYHYKEAQKQVEGEFSVILSHQQLAWPDGFIN